MRAWLRSLRFTLCPRSKAIVEYNRSPVALLLWHNRLYIAAEMARRYRPGRPLHALVSASKDGAWLTAFFSLMGMATIRGSSSHLGREAVNAMISCLKSGHDVGITPDGPRGPCYEFKSGSLIIARRAHAPIILVGAQFESKWSLPSWDRFIIPRPFSSVHISCTFIPQTDLQSDREKSASYVQSRLREINPSEPPLPVI